MALTPMMQQYMEVKNKYKEYILMYRLGDFYEMFFEDAKVAAQELKLTLTARNCGLEEKAPMCGVPYHSVEPYITKLVDAGYKIAICEQIGDPSPRGIVRREVSRLITPGTNQNLDASKADSNNFLCGVVQIDKKYAIAFVDITTGEFRATKISRAVDVLDEIKRMKPVEIIYNGVLSINEVLIVDYCLGHNISCTELLENYFDIQECEDQIKKQFNVDFITSLGLDEDSLVVVCGSIIKYIFETQKSFLANILTINIYSQKSNMLIDGFTTRNLELVETMRDAKKIGSLFWVLDKTKTSMGARFLRNSILSPSTERGLLLKRYDAIEELTSKIIPLDELRENLSGIYDLERLAAKVVSESFNPRDMLALKQSFKNIEPIIDILSDMNSKYLKDIYKKIDPLNDLMQAIETSINENAGFSIRDGGIIKSGYNSQVDECREASINGKDWILKLESDQKKSTGIKNLRIKYSKNFGYCVELSRSQADLVPENYIRRQTLTNAERYTFEELKIIEDKILGAEEKLYKLELDLFLEVKSKIFNNISRILETAKLLAEIDFIQSLAHVSNINGYVRPELVSDGSLIVKNGRHPVVEKMLKKNQFIANDVYLDMKKERFAIITGPNMSGKSTYMRQTALICIMAQIGSFVPCKSCTMDIVDKVFTRVGASDDLASGQSTFMVEMTEVSNILRNATPKSLIILDEIGRGTSTFDGLSLAWAIVEYIADKNQIGAKTIFATHYHELTELEGKVENVVNYYIDVYEKNDNVVFLRKILRGGANKSYGIQVAKLAGVPDKVIQRAKELATELERADIAANVKVVARENRQYTMFDYCDPMQDDDDIIKEIRNLDPDSISPREALEFIYDIKKRLRNGY